MIMEQILAEGNRSKGCRKVNLSTTNPSWNWMYLKQGFRGTRPTNNCLRKGTIPQVFELFERRLGTTY